ncbi:MAG TPA: choice-of-anchor tandem repeat GloVer-containing protein [Bryobacteraceae bacterium]|nr:choice-of-anchor tandem repeat GloVer-containing protein [Bryobacteraceae bacterium]
MNVKRVGVKVLVAVLAATTAVYGQTLNVLHNFAHNELGYLPVGGVTIGSNGELYGTTVYGGASGCGILYELVPPTSPGGTWTEVVLHNLTASEGNPTSGLLLGAGGALYGAAGPGSQDLGGEVFQLLPPTGARARWVEQVLYAFNTSSGGYGSDPRATPVFGPHMALYGSTNAGGAYTDGTIYRLLPPGAQGGAWTEQVLHEFDYFAGDGTSPSGALALSSNLTIYGAASYGASGYGAIFQLAPPAQPGGTWTETLIHSFTGGSDSGYPNGVILGPNGVLYGTTNGSPTGGGCTAPCGTVFQLTPPASPGGTWAETILHSFTGGGFTADGTNPNSAPVLGPNGVIYGTTLNGGLHNVGMIYELLPPSTPGGAWAEVPLYSFNDTEGAGPLSVAVGPDGNLYGTTSWGGVSNDGNNQGVVFQLVLQQ